MPISEIPSIPTYLTAEEFVEKASSLLDLSSYLDDEGEITEDGARKINEALVLAETLIDAEFPMYCKFDEDQVRLFPILHREYYQTGYFPYQIKIATMYTAANLLGGNLSETGNSKVESESWSATGYSVKFSNSVQNNSYQLPTMAQKILSSLIGNMYKFTR